MIKKLKLKLKDSFLFFKDKKVKNKKCCFS